MANKWFGYILSLADLEKIEEKKNDLEEKKKNLREIALSVTKLAEFRRMGMSLTEAKKKMNVYKSAQEKTDENMDLLIKQMEKLRIQEEIRQQSVIAGCYKEKNKPMHEPKFLNQPTDGSSIKYTLDELLTIGISNFVQLKANPEQMEFKNEDKTTKKE